jgi:hypothetical protein
MITPGRGTGRMPVSDQEQDFRTPAVVIDVDSVAGAGENGFFQQARG